MDAKPGWKTTEFWLSLAAVLLGALSSSGLALGHGLEAAVGIAASALAAFGYSASRARVKAPADPAPPGSSLRVQFGDGIAATPAPTVEGQARKA